MTDDDKRHFDTARRLARHAAEGEWLAQAYEMLARQRAVVGALSEARESLWDSNETELGRLGKLQTHAARVTIATVESIMRHSGLTDLDRSDWGDQAATPIGEAREESIPW